MLRHIQLPNKNPEPMSFSSKRNIVDIAGHLLFSLNEISIPTSEISFSTSDISLPLTFTQYCIFTLSLLDYGLYEQNSNKRLYSSGDVCFSLAGNLWRPEHFSFEQCKSRSEVNSHRERCDDRRFLQWILSSKGLTPSRWLIYFSQCFSFPPTQGTVSFENKTPT